MARSSDCDSCRQAQTCKEVSRRAGGDEGPAVTSAALVAFVLPLVLFVAALSGFGPLLRGLVREPYLTPLTLVLALVTTAAVMLAGRFLVRRRRK